MKMGSNGQNQGDLGFMLSWLNPVKQAMHDIRSPIAALEAAAYIGAADLPADTLELIQSATRRIRSIAESLKPYSIGNDSDPTSLNASPSRLETTDVFRVIREAAAETQAILAHRHPPVRLSVLATTDAQRLRVLADPAQFARILANLLQNSIESIDQGGSIRLLLSCTDSQVIVTVRDTGRGIAPADLHRVTERGFTRGKAGGSGLGLSHAATQLRQWGGNLEIQSVVGEGTEVSIRLPIAGPRLAAPSN